MIGACPEVGYTHPRCKVYFFHFDDTQYEMENKIILVMLME